MKTEKTCVCGKVFFGRLNKKYCSLKCYPSQPARRIAYLNLSSSSVGTIGELRASTDMLKKGYEVFRAMSPAASCDLIIRRDTALRTVEVRTGHVTNKGILCYPKHRIRAELIAVVLPEDIVYIPAL